VDVVFSRNARAALVPRAKAGVLDSGSVRGRVTDAKTGQAVPNAAVVVEGTRFGARTDEDGRYSIAGVPAGTYTVTARRLGYQRAAQSVTTSGGEVVLDFTLAVLPPPLDEIIFTFTGRQRRWEGETPTGTTAPAPARRT